MRKCNIHWQVLHCWTDLRSHHGSYWLPEFVRTYLRLENIIYFMWNWSKKRISSTFRIYWSKLQKDQLKTLWCNKLKQIVLGTLVPMEPPIGCTLLVSFLWLPMVNGKVCCLNSSLTIIYIYSNECLGHYIQEVCWERWNNYLWRGMWNGNQ